MEMLSRVYVLLQPREADCPPSNLVPFLEQFATKDRKSSNSVSLWCFQKLLSQKNFNIYYVFISIIWKRTFAQPKV